MVVLQLTFSINQISIQTNSLPVKVFPLAFVCNLIVRVGKIIMVTCMFN